MEYTKEFFQKKGSIGGRKSKRKLTKEQASKMGRLSGKKRVKRNNVDKLKIKNNVSKEFKEIIKNDKR